jgi:hypothetical protein
MRTAEAFWLMTDAATAVPDGTAELTSDNQRLIELVTETGGTTQ